MLLVHVPPDETIRATMTYTLGQAAKATGKSKPTIQRAIKSGSISAAKADDGSYEINPSELHRVFPPVTSASNAEQALKQSVPPSDTVALQREIELLRERLTDKDGVIDDLRQRLDTEAEERRRTQAQLTALLTDQSQREQEEPQRRRWFSFGTR
jgi:excisionase family DNA binding protein